MYGGWSILELRVLFDEADETNTCFWIATNKLVVVNKEKVEV